ncbi:hypothetical protein HDV01_000246 [Terramyces sp. JEL0728]|nr:hypothetical protein HDV01_000246 [Terramyces sp. JEL0728]
MTDREAKLQLAKSKLAKFQKKKKEQSLSTEIAVPEIQVQRENITMVSPTKSIGQVSETTAISSEKRQNSGISPDLQNQPRMVVSDRSTSKIASPPIEQGVNKSPTQPPLLSAQVDQNSNTNTPLMQSSQFDEELPANSEIEKVLEQHMNDQYQPDQHYQGGEQYQPSNSGYESYPNYQNDDITWQKDGDAIEIQNLSLEGQCQYYSDMYQQVVAANSVLAIQLQESQDAFQSVNSELGHIRQLYNNTRDELLSRNTSVSPAIASELQSKLEWCQLEEERLQNYALELTKENQRIYAEDTSLREAYKKFNHDQLELKHVQEEFYGEQEKLGQAKEWLKLEEQELRNGQQQLQHDQIALARLKDEAAASDTAAHYNEAIQVLERERKELQDAQAQFKLQKQQFENIQYAEKQRLDKLELEMQEQWQTKLNSNIEIVGTDQQKWAEIKEAQRVMEEREKSYHEAIRMFDKEKQEFAQLEDAFELQQRSFEEYRNREQSRLDALNFNGQNKDELDQYANEYKRKCQDLEYSNQELQNEKRQFQLLREEAQKQIDGQRAKYSELEKREKVVAEMELKYQSLEFFNQDLQRRQEYLDHLEAELTQRQKELGQKERTSPRYNFDITQISSDLDRLKIEIQSPILDKLHYLESAANQVISNMQDLNKTSSLTSTADFVKVITELSKTNNYLLQHIKPSDFSKSREETIIELNGLSEQTKTILQDPNTGSADVIRELVRSRISANKKINK